MGILSFISVFYYIPDFSIGYIFFPLYVDAVENRVAAVHLSRFFYFSSEKIHHESASPFTYSVKPLLLICDVSPLNEVI